MIDVEANIFDTVYQTVAPLCAEGKFISKQKPDLTALPAADLFELSNTTVTERQSSTPIENMGRITYQFDVYAETKAECRRIYAAADAVMISLNFSRVSGNFIDNPGNLDVSRYTARYVANVDTDGVLYRA